jgi:hypothetical protein
MRTFTELTNTPPQWAGLFLDSQGKPVEAQQSKSIMQQAKVNFSDALSDDLTGYFIRQLTDIETTFYEVLYLPLKGMTLFPASSAYNIAAENILFQVWDYRGQARDLPNYPTDDYPESDVLLKQLSVPVRSTGNSFSYSIQELRASAMANQPLDQMKQIAARRVLEQRINKIIWTGDINTGRVGVLTDPDVPYGTVPADGAGGTTQFVNKTGQQIYRDISKCIQGVFENSDGLFVADTLVLPPSQYETIARTPFAEQYRANSILEGLKMNFPGLNIEYAAELKGASSITPSNDVMIAYQKKMEFCCHAIPIPFEMLPPQQVAMKYKVYCHARTAGMIIRQPISLNIKEGV